jgi:antagonist of KipI
MTILQPGFHTTIQDGGRHGYQRYGVPVGGAVDHVAFRLGNILVGNDPNEGVLELTLVGPTIRFASRVTFALCGADFDATIDGEPVPLWRPVTIEPGHLLSCGRASSGFRGYLAIAGGIDIAPLLGSVSTTPAASLGGLDGRALRRGDTLALRDPVSVTVRSNIGECRGFSYPRWAIWPGALPRYGPSPTLRIVPGEWLDRLSAESRARLLEGVFTVTSDSDRIGCRLAGCRIDLPSEEMLLSEGTALGAIQLPPSGDPIILLNDCGTTGGYPVIAHVIHADLPLLAQIPLGGSVRFESVGLVDAWEISRRQERMVRRFEVSGRGGEWERG